MTTDRRIPASPRPSPDTLPYWQAAQEGRLLVKRCRACGDAHFYPRVYCPFCFSADTAWEQASGRGVIYSYSIARKAATPYVPAYITLEEGPCMMSNIVGADPAGLYIGQAVRVVFEPSENGQPIPMFRPQATGEDSP